MKNVFRAAVLLFAVTLFMSTSSFGQSENRQDRKKPPTFEELLEKMDTNEDGKLSKKEVKGPLKEHFVKVDADEDGFITKLELENGVKSRTNRRPKTKS